MPDYSRTVIYKLCCKDPSITDIYIGHTTDFRKRKCQHKCYCHNEKDKSYNVYVYRYIREHGGWDNWDMIEVCRQSCIDANDARKLERKYLEELGATLNIAVPNRTYKEYREDNLEKDLEHCRKYRKENPEKIKDYQHNYYINNTDKLKGYQKKYQSENTKKIKDYHKKYQEENQEKLKETYQKYYKENRDKIIDNVSKYYEENRDKISEYNRQRYLTQKEIKTARERLFDID
jgi:hypothetical protein